MQNGPGSGVQGRLKKKEIKRNEMGSKGLANRTQSVFKTNDTKTIARGNDGGILSPGQDGTDHPPHVAPETSSSFCPAAGSFS